MDLKLASSCLFVVAVAVTCDVGLGVRLMTSGYGSRFYFYDLDTETGATAEARPPQDVDPGMSWVEFDAATGNLYAAHEVDGYDDGTNVFEGTGVFSRWSLDAESGDFVKREVVSAEGLGPCHISLSKANGLAFVAKYTGGSFSAFSLEGDDLAVGRAVYNEVFLDAGSGVDPDRQEASHVHGSWVYRDRFVYAADLGADRVYVYSISPGFVLRLPLDVGVTPGFGPRHGLVDEDNDLFYLLCELQPVVVVFSVDPDSGALQELASVPYVLEDADFEADQRGAELALAPSGDFLYLTHRGYACVVTFEVVAADDGYLLQRAVTQTGGAENRHLLVTSDGASLITPSQNTDQLQVFAVSDDAGAIEKAVDVDSGNQPAVVVVLEE